MSVSELIRVTCPNCSKKYGINPVHIRSDKGIIKCKGCNTDIPVHKSAPLKSKSKPPKIFKRKKQKEAQSKAIFSSPSLPENLEDTNGAQKKDLPLWAEEFGSELLLSSPLTKTESTETKKNNNHENLAQTSTFSDSKIKSHINPSDDFPDIDLNDFLSDDSSFQNRIENSPMPDEKYTAPKKERMEIPLSEEQAIASVLRESVENGDIGDIDIDLSTPTSGFGFENDTDDNDIFFPNLGKNSENVSFSGEETIIQGTKGKSLFQDDFDMDFSDWSNDPIGKKDSKTEKTDNHHIKNTDKTRNQMGKNPLLDSQMMDSSFSSHQFDAKPKKSMRLTTRFVLFVIFPLIAIAVATLILSLHSMVSIQKDNLRQSMQIIRDINESLIHQISGSVANQTRLFLMNQPYLTKENFNRDIYFKKIVLQKVGNKGFTSLYEIAGADDSWKIWAHFSPTIVGKNLKTFKNQLNQDFIDFWRIISGVREGKVTKGYTKWPDKTGQFKKAFLVCTPIEGTQYAIASCFFIDEIQVPLEKIEASNKKASEKMRTQIGLIMVSGILIIGLYLFLFGQRLSERLKILKTQVDQINSGESDFRIIVSGNNDEIGQLTRSIWQMQKDMKFKD